VACLSDWLGRRASFGEPHGAGNAGSSDCGQRAGRPKPAASERRIVARYGGFRDNGRIASQVCFDLR
jgi:hypothetical protein